MRCKVRQAFTEWLADPVRVLATMNYTAAIACMAFGWYLPGLAGFWLGVAGTLIIVEMRRALRG